MASAISTSEPLTKRQILCLLEETPAGDLFDAADAVRKTHCGDTVYVRAIVEFSNCCARNCLYCGLRSGNRNVTRYRMTPDEIHGAVDRVAEQGIQTVILQSGDDLHCTRDVLCDIVRGIKARHTDMAVTLSLGERPLDDYAALRESGADRYLIKHETINPDLYAQLHPGQSHAERMAIIRRLRELGYQVGVGFMVGLPGQTLEVLADEILFLQEFRPDMAGIGPFLPQRDTPLGSHEHGARDLVLRVLALARIASPLTHLPATTALASLDSAHGYAAGLKAGCNVIMVNVTPAEYRGNYQIYDGRERFDLAAIRAVIEQAGRRFSGARGDSFLT
jgi:biotin synthase